MSQIDQLIHTLKKQLKANGITYADLAAALSLSEASIKRLFANQQFTLPRLASICDLIGMDLSELMQSANRAQSNLQQLTQSQEEEIAQDPLLLLVTVNVINGLSFDDLLCQFAISEAQCIRKLAQLDRLQLIDLLPNNRIRLKVAPNFHWIKNGPIQQFFHTTIEQEFFRSRFEQDNETLLVLNGVLGDQTIAEIQQKMQRLAQDFNRCIQEDIPLPVEKKTGVTAIVAMRPWEYSVFDQFNKD